MIVVQPLKAKFPTNQENMKHVPQNLMIIYKIIHIIFGLDFGFFDYKTKTMRFFLKCFTFFSTLSIAVTSVLSAHIYSLPEIFIFYVYFVIQYMTFFLIMFIFKKPFCGFLQVMGNINAEFNKQNLDHSIKLNIEISLGALFLLARMVLEVVWCIEIDIHKQQCISPNWVLNIFYMILISHDLILLTMLLVYYIAYINLETLACQLKNDNLNSYDKYNNIYKSIVDATENMKSSLDPLVSLLI